MEQQWTSPAPVFHQETLEGDEGVYRGDLARPHKAHGFTMALDLEGLWVGMACLQRLSDPPPAHLRTSFTFYLHCCSQDAGESRRKLLVVVGHELSRYWFVGASAHTINPDPALSGFNFPVPLIRSLPP